MNDGGNMSGPPEVNGESSGRLVVGSCSEFYLGGEGGPPFSIIVGNQTFIRQSGVRLLP